MSIVSRKCPHCGTEWDFETRGNRGRQGGGMSGFIESTIKYHIIWCKSSSADQRLAFIDRNQKRLAKKPNLHTKVYFDRNHPGVVGLSNTASTRLGAGTADPVDETVAPSG